MLSNTLNTNEVRNAAAAEVEFSRLAINNRETTFAQVGETPASPHRLSIKHTEVGAGIKLRRRSVARIDKTIVSTVDNQTPVVVSAYKVVDAPIGALIAATEIANVLAELDSFTSTTDGTTLLLNGTGNGNAALLNGGL